MYVSSELKCPQLQLQLWTLRPNFIIISKDSSLVAEIVSSYIGRLWREQFLSKYEQLPPNKHWHTFFTFLNILFCHATYSKSVIDKDKVFLSVISWQPLPNYNKTHPTKIDCKKCEIFHSLQEKILEFAESAKIILHFNGVILINIIRLSFII